MKKNILLISLFFSISFFGQPGSLDLSFNPNDLGQGISIGAEINDSKVQGDGKIIIVGSFTSYNGTPVNHIARINVDGTLDLSFNPGTGPNSRVYTLSFQYDGKIIIGGDFTLVNGISRNKIARLNPDGSLDVSFNPGSGPTGTLSPTINKTSIQIDGKIIIGGDFTLFNGISRNLLARLNPDGTLDTTFNTGTGFTGNNIYTINLQSDSKIIVGGDFSSYNGISSKNIARINTDGSLDSSFIIGTGANGIIRTSSIQFDGKIIIGGSFTTYNSISSNYLARLDTNGALDTSFFIGSGLNYLVKTTAIQSDGKIIVGGRFTIYNGNASNNLLRLNSNGTIDNLFGSLQVSLGNEDINCVSILNDGKVIIAGNFKFVNDEWRNGVAFIDNTGLLTNINKGFGVQGGRVNVIKPYGLNKVIIGGTFYSYDGYRRRGIAMINNDGTIDMSFNNVLGITNGLSSVSDIEVVGNKIIVVGAFNSYNGSGANNIIQLNSDGSRDVNFNTGTGPNSVINTITSIGNNQFLIGGSFTTFNGTSINKIARINYNGSLDSSFNPVNVGSTGNINTIEVLPNFFNGRYIAGGKFTVNGVNNIFLCGFNNVGQTDASGGAMGIGDTVNMVLQDGSNWNYVSNSGFYQTNLFLTSAFISISTNGPIYCISKQSDGKIIIGGDFTTYNGTPTNYFARLNADGTLDTAFNIGTGPNDIVRTTSIQSDGKIIIGGDFTSYNGIGKNRIARINSGAALSNPSFDLSTTVIYPNPSNGYFNIKIDDNVTTKTIEVYTLLGQKIYSKQITENTSAIDLSNQSKGIYIYKINTIDGESKSGKLIID